MNNKKLETNNLNDKNYFKFLQRKTLYKIKIPKQLNK